ncbi:MAG TPA: hypothetical protein DDW52_24200 [Planctomycetaceae bacterium]|nr:hypothetical protein [Planctomycetaceae bacterium]
MIAELPVVDFTQAMNAAGLATVALLGLGGLWVLATRRGEHKITGRNWLAKISYLVFTIVVLVLAVSSFGAIVTEGHMLGYALLAHMAGAGAFVFLLLAIAYFYLPRGTDIPSDNRWWVARWSAWGLVVAGIVTAGTMFLSMLPVLGTQDMLAAIAVHRFSGLLVVVCMVFHFFALCCVRLGLR